MNKKLIVTNRKTGEVIREVNGYDYSNFMTASFSPNEIPFVVAADLPSVSSTKTLRNPDGSTYNSQILVSPATEQILSGTIYGNFQVDETVFQGQYIPVIVNNLTLSGVTATDYNPTVGTIGISGPELGNRSIQFMGSYLDTDTKAAGLQLPSFTTTTVPYFMLSGFVYLEAEPSGAYDPIIVTRSSNGKTDNTNDSFRLEYDTSNKQLQFHFATTNYGSAGYQAITNVSPANGVTLNQWHQFAIAYSNQGGSACVSSYWNGNRYAQTTGITGYLKNSTGYFMLGSGASGDRPFKGWVEHIMVSMGGVTTALREFNHGLTAPTDAAAQFAGDYTVYALTMNGPVGSSLFPCASTKRVISTVTFTDTLGGKIGVANVNRENTSNHGTTLFTGLNGGHTGSSSASNSGYLFGYNSGACMVISGVTSGYVLADLQKVKGSLVDHTITYLFGSTAMRGTCGSVGDFPLLLRGPAGSFSGRTFSFMPVAANVSMVRSLYDNITIVGSTGTYYLSDFEGNMYTFSTGGIKNLYGDIVNYQANAFAAGTTYRNAIAGVTNATNLLSLNGISDSGVIQKLAPRVDSSGMLYLSGKARATKKTNTPETQAIIDIKGIMGIDEV
jgi:hypothetical protein